MSGKKDVHLHAKNGLAVRPDGQGGSTIEGDGESWTISVEDAKPALIQDWTVVETLGADDTTGAAAAIARWKSRGFDPRAFEVGTVFGTGGEVIDTREVRIAVDPVAQGKGAARAGELAKRFGVATSVHEELVRRPSGTIVAKNGTTVIRNPSVLWFAPHRTTETITVADVPTNTGGSQLDTGHEDRRYWGTVYVTLDHDGSLVAANAVAEDKLLAGLVPAEMYPDAPEAALEAQAIAARTELLQKIGRRNLTDPFLLCSTQQCQVYAGAGKEDARATRAIEKTRGLVLLRDGGGLVDIRYSASCGGHTEDNEAIWGGEADPSLRGRQDNAKDGISRVTDANLDAFLSEDPHDAWCGRGKLAKKQLPLDRAARRRRPDDARRGRVSGDRPHQEPRREAARIVGPHHDARDRRRQGERRGHRRSAHPSLARRPQVDAVPDHARGQRVRAARRGLRPRRRHVPDRRDRHGRGRQAAHRDPRALLPRHAPAPPVLMRRAFAALVAATACHIAPDTKCAIRRSPPLLAISDAAARVPPRRSPKAVHHRERSSAAARASRIMPRHHRCRRSRPTRRPPWKTSSGDGAARRRARARCAVPARAEHRARARVT